MIRRLRLALLLAVVATRASAHDIPRDVTVQMFVRPDGHTLHVLARVPLRGITDVEYPRRERDTVDLARIEPALRDAANVWFLDDIDLYEGETRLGEPRVVSTRLSLE